MTDAAIAADFHKALDVEGNFAAKLALHAYVVIDIFSQLGYVVFVEILHPRVGIDARLRQDLFGRSQTDTVNIGKTDFYSLFSG